MFPEFALALGVGAATSMVVVVLPFLILNGVLAWQNRKRD